MDFLTVHSKNSNLHKNLEFHMKNLASSTRKLSSRLRINDASDDTSGMAVREFMRSRIVAAKQGGTLKLRYFQLSAWKVLRERVGCVNIFFENT